LTTLLSFRRALLVGAFAIAGVTLLQGCVPVIVAGGVGATALMASDRRTAGTYIDDESIEWKVADRMRKHFGTINNINVTSYNRTMLLTGEVQDEGVRAEAQRLAGTVTNVRAVVNELVVAPPSTLSSRSNDTTITANIKARFVNNKVFSPNHVKIVTEAGVAFLLGVVTHAEGDHAAEIARTSRGVSKVVKVFEYTDENRSHHGNGFPPEAP
jgi:osmotically-inducible protein OsmY